MTMVRLSDARPLYLPARPDDMKSEGPAPFRQRLQWLIGLAPIADRTMTGHGRHIAYARQG